MKAQLQTLIGTAVLGLALVTQSLPAGAGVAAVSEVYVSPSGSYAQGSRMGARYSADSTQSIGCLSLFDQGYSGGSPYNAVYCFATDKTGRNTYCYSRDARFVDAVQAITDSSHIYFAVPNFSTRVCTELTVDNASLYLK